MTATAKGRIDWSLNMDNETYRDYLLRMHVVTTDPLDGPERVFFASGLPSIGAPWSFGNDDDPWALRTPETRVTPIITREPNKHWIVELKFSNRPMWRCSTDQVDDPLAEPQGISGSFVKYVRNAEKDRFGRLILSSSHEKIEGIERDANRPSVVIEQNIATLGLSTFTQMIDGVNDAVLWGLPARWVKLSNVSWSRKLYGVCSYYYTRRFEFDVKYGGWDVSDVADAGFKEFDDDLYADTPANRADPTKYRIVKDGRGENTPTKVLLNGLGSRLTNPLAPVFLPTIQLYDQFNLFLLGIPASL